MFKLSLKPIYHILAAGLLILATSAHAGGLTDFNGTPKSFADYTGNGKWLVVMFWASDCHVCNKEAHEYVAFHSKHKDTDATVLGISSDGLDNKAAAQRFIDEHKVNFPNLIGSLEDVAALYYETIGDFWVGTPTFLIFDPDGKIRAAQVGAVPTAILEDFISQNSIVSIE